MEEGAQTRSVLKISTPKQEHSKGSRRGQIEVTGLGANVEDRDRGAEKWKTKQQVEHGSKVEG